MSLVDYASSSDEDASENEEEEPKEKREVAEAPKPEPAPPPPPPVLHRNRPTSSLGQQQEKTAYSTLPSIEKLPDVSLLLNSPTLSSTLSGGGDHASRVAAAMAESASRKRNSNVVSSSAPHGKLPRGTLSHKKNVPNTGGGLLVPPQLSGRSNVVTEDISKLFVKRQTDASSH